MKRHIPADIDALMWTVAESGDSDAIEQFGERYPDQRPEMLKRLQMVRSLKGSRPDAVQKFAHPRFVPTKAPLSFSIPRWAWVVAPAILAGVAFGSYSIAIRALSGSSASRVGQPEPKPVVEQMLPKPLPDDSPHPNGVIDPKVPPINDPEAVVKLQPYEQPLGLRIERISLHAAIDAIGRSSGLQIELAPGLEDVDISMKYSNLSAIAILQDMGANFGFTVFEQSPGSVLIVPEVDPKKQPDPNSTVRPNETKPDQDSSKKTNSAVLNR